MFNDHSNIKNVAIYTRVSTDEQRERGFSFEAQLKTLRSHAGNKQWKITKEYTDGGYSGRNTRRPDYQKMMNDIDQWDAILVLKMDRIHRNSKNFMVMMDQLRKHGKEFISFQENLDTSSAMGRFVMDILQRIAQLESEQIGERVAYAMAEKAKQPDNGFMGHRTPFGYKWDGEIGKFKTEPRKLEIVKSVFDLYLNGKFDPIEEDENGFKSKISGKYVSKDMAVRLRTRAKNEGGCSVRSIALMLNKSQTTIRYYLNNIFYAGYERYCHYFRKIKQPNFRPVITKEIWNQTQEKMRRNCRTQNYDPILIPDDEPEFFILNNEEVNTIPIINRAKHNYLT